VCASAFLLCYQRCLVLCLLYIEFLERTFWLDILESTVYMCDSSLFVSHTSHLFFTRKDDWISSVLVLEVSCLYPNVETDFPSISLIKLIVTTCSISTYKTSTSSSTNSHVMSLASNLLIQAIHVNSNFILTCKSSPS